MGSDLYMEQRNFRPRPNHAEWQGDTLVLFKDYFYKGYQEVWRGPVNDDTRGLIEAMGFKVPEKPLPDPRLYTLANLLHSKQCDYNHPDECNWFYEQPLVDSWDQAVHKKYFERAQQLTNGFPHVDLNDILAIVSRL